MKQRIDLFVNISIAILCLTVSGLLVKRQFFPELPPEPTQATTRGDLLDLPEVLIPGNTEFIVVAALAPACSFCNESMPFYRALSDRVGVEQPSLRFIAAVRETAHAEEERSKLEAAGVGIDQVVVTDFKALGVPGTPMLIVADRQGEVLGAWLGRLDENKEQEVLETLGLSGGVDQASLHGRATSDSAITAGW